MLGGHEPYLNYDEVPICSLVNFILKEFKYVK